MRALLIAALVVAAGPALAQAKGDKPPASASAGADDGKVRGQGQQAATGGSRMVKARGAASPRP